MKQTSEFYEARDAIEKGKLKKTSLRKLRKYRTALLSRRLEQPRFPSDAATIDFGNLLSELDKEIARREESRWTSFHSYKKGIVIGVVGSLLATLIIAAFLQIYQAIQIEKKKQEKLIQQPTSEPSPPPIPTQSKDKGQ